MYIARSHQPPGRGPLVAHAAHGSTTSKTLMLGCCCRQYGGPRFLEVTEERTGPSGLRDDDDDDDDLMFTAALFHSVMKIAGLVYVCSCRIFHQIGKTKGRFK